MKKLKKKLKQHSTMDNTELICNCHKVDRFSPLMSLFRDGYAFIRGGNADRMSYGVKLHKAMMKFYDDFVPHMHEEENVCLVVNFNKNIFRTFIFRIFNHYFRNISLKWN
jgi:hypothetical protein